MECADGKPPYNNKVCNVNPESWYPCTHKAGYNYNSTAGGPCVFLKLNKATSYSSLIIQLHLTSLVVDIQLDSRILQLHHIAQQLPQELKKSDTGHGGSYQQLQPRIGTKCLRVWDRNEDVKRCVLLQLKTVWVSCEGENPADVENMGPVNYYPTLGFTGQYFPFTNKEGYLAPLVAVHFESPERKYLFTQWNKWLKWRNEMIE